MHAAALRLEQAPPLGVPLRFFLTAPLFGMAAGALLAWQGRAVLETPFHPGTLALTHLVTLGWLTMVMLGALYQITPVLVGVVVPWLRLVPLVHAGLTLGAGALVLGLGAGVQPLRVAALALLGLTFAVVLLQWGLALHRAPPGGGPTVAAIRLALAALAATVALGLLFAWEHAFGWLPLHRPGMVAVHAYLGLGGWIGSLIAGVGYAVLPMFYLARPFPDGRARWVQAGLAAALVLAPPTSAGALAPAWPLLPAAAGAAAFAVFAWTVAGQLRHRRRKAVDATLRFWQLGLAGGAAAMVLLAAAVLLDGPRWPLALGVAYLLGFAGAIEQGMRYRIVSFLVWLHRFSPHAGRLRIPMMGDIVAQGHARRQWLLFLAAVGLLLPAALLRQDALARAGGLLLLASQAYLGAILLGAARYNPPLAPLASASAGAGRASA